MSEQSQERFNLEIRINTHTGEVPCVICGCRGAPKVGADLFLEGTDSLVCHPCGGEHAPHLLAELSRMEKAEREENVDPTSWSFLDKSPEYAHEGPGALVF